MNKQKTNKISLANEKGATLIEASVVLPLFIVFVLGIILVCTQLFASYKTYFANYQTLKTISTGPTRKVTGEVDTEVEDRLKVVLAANLKKYNTGVVLGTDQIYIKNSTGCFKVEKNSLGIYFVRCGSTISVKLKIIPNSWLTLETHIKPVGLKFNRIPIPTMKIISTVRMYDWPV